MLGEINIALLRSIIKDIEDVARTPSTGLGTNQYSAANPGGGHPQIVEGVSNWAVVSSDASFFLPYSFSLSFPSIFPLPNSVAPRFGILYQAYAWGFDIRNWQGHLNPLTWPEILREFALSAGFGPQLKRKNIEQTYLRDDNEVTSYSFQQLSQCKIWLFFVILFVPA